MAPVPLLHNFHVTGGDASPAPIVGNVCMDMLMIEITNIDCKEGDEVIVFGADNSVENLTDSINSISYELLTAISQRVKRVITRK